MTIHPTDDVITSDVTPHTATRCPGGWAVTWLGDRTVDRNLAITAMLLADEARMASRGDLLSDEALKSCRLIDDLARELGMTGEQAIDMVRETLPPAPVHDTHAIPAGDEPATPSHHETWLAFDPQPGDLFTDRRNRVWFVVDKDCASHLWLVTAAGHQLIPAEVCSRYGPLNRVYPMTEPASVADWRRELLAAKTGQVVVVEWSAPTDEATAALEAELGRYGTSIADMVWRSETGNIALGTSCESCGGTPDLYLTPAQAVTFAAYIALAAAAAPAKTHDLSIRRTAFGNVSVAVESDGNETQVYLLDGTAKDLGRVLAALTPAQVQLLISELTGGEK